MKNILYRDLHAEIIDRIDNFTTPRQALGEFLRQKKASDVAIARAASRAMFHLLSTLPPTATPDLIHTVDLDMVRDQDNGVKVFEYPPQAFTERENEGILSFVIDGEEVDFADSEPYQQVVHTARSRIHNINAFNADHIKRRLYVACTGKVQAVILKKPHSIFAPPQNMFHGALIEITNNTAASGTILVSDGVNADVEVPVLSGDNEAAKIDKIVSAISDSDEFYYKAVNDDGKVQLALKYSVDFDRQMFPSVSGGGTGTYTISDNGTYEIPVPYHYIYVMATTAFNMLITDQLEPQPQPQQEE